MTRLVQDSPGSTFGGAVQEADGGVAYPRDLAFVSVARSAESGCGRCLAALLARAVLRADDGAGPGDAGPGEGSRGA